jgi:hypothetical protein
MSEGILDLFSLGQGGVAFTDDDSYTPISFPLAMPTTPGFRRFRMKQERSQLVSESPTTLKSQVQVSSGERWVAEFALPAMRRETAGPWQGFFNMLDGKVGTFLLGDALGRTPMGNPLGTPVVKDPDQTGRVLTIQGCTTAITAWLKAGDYFQIGERLYQVSRDANSDENGYCTLDFWPRLREVYDVDTPLITANCKGLFRMTTVSWEAWEADELQLYSISVSAEEAL